MSSDAIDATAAVQDFSGASWATAWQSTFFALYLLVMAPALLLYGALLRAVATVRGKEASPAYLMLLALGMLGAVEAALVVHQFIALHVVTEHSTFMCR